MKIYVLLYAMLSLTCTNANKNTDQSSSNTSTKTSGKKQHWEGAFTNGMKKTYISFDVSADGKQLQKLTFNGYWYCNGSLTQDIVGPQKNFSITGNKVDGIIVEPEGGGASATRYELHAVFNGNKAEGTLRMNINGLGCDTHKLNWTAEKN